MRKHPQLHHPSVRAMLAVALPLADLARSLGESAVVETFAVACGELLHGFAMPPHSPDRRGAHHRAWVGVKELDRVVTAARLGRHAPASVVQRAQRAVDRADVLVGALPGASPHEFTRLGRGATSHPVVPLADVASQGGS